MLDNINPSLEIYNNKNGFLCITCIDGLGNCKNNFFKCDDLQQASRFLDQVTQKGNYNIYNSTATYNKPYKRTENNIKQVLELYLDIDNHIKPYTLKQAQAFIDEIKQLFDIAIPEPSLIIYSGRGVQLHFTISNYETDKRKVKEVNRALQELFSNICKKIDAFINVDGMSIDEVHDIRVLRTAYTLNLKSNTYTKPLYTSNTSYTLDELIKAFNLNYTYTKGNNKGKKRDLKETIGKNQDKVIEEYKNKCYKRRLGKQYTKESLNTAKIQDLFKLIELRNAKGIREGYRNNVFFTAIPLFNEKHNNDINKVIDDLEELNNAFLEPVSDAQLEAWIRQTKTFRGYQKNETIINKLAITEEEQTHLKTLITKKESNRRYNAKNRGVRNAKSKVRYRSNPQAKIKRVQAYNGLNKDNKKQYDKERYSKDSTLLNYANNRYKPIKEANELKKANLKAQALKLYEAGIKVKEILNKLEISKTTLYRYINELKEKANEIIEEVKDYIEELTSCNELTPELIYFLGKEYQKFFHFLRVPKFKYVDNST